MRYQEFKNAIKNKKVAVGVVGLGYVGLPTALSLAAAGVKVVGVDIDRARVRKTNSLHGSRKFIATANFAEVKKCKVILVAVPTPITKHKTPDTGAIEAAAKNIAKHLAKDSLVILESTTYPGTTRELLKPMLERSGKNFYLAYAPERIDPGNKEHNFTEVPKIVGGIDKKSTDLAALFYSTFLKNVYKVSSPEVAEFTKLLENIFRLVNVSAVNELKLLADKMDIDIWEAIEAAKTKPYGYMPFYPGPGVGGHCFEENQVVLTSSDQGIDTVTVKDLYGQIENPENQSTESILENEAPIKSGVKLMTRTKLTSILKPQTNIKTISVSPESNHVSLEPITYVSRRESDHIIHIRCHHNYELKVTDKHPVFVYSEGRPRLKFAEDLIPGDRLLFTKQIPSLYPKPSFDLIETISKNYPHLISQLRIKPVDNHLRQYKKYLDPLFVGDDKKQDFFKNNYLPLKEFLRIEKSLPLKRLGLLITSGRGPSFQGIPAVITLDNEWARLMGYYLSEGCITKEAKTMRIRFTFHSDEIEYINDIEQILKSKSIRFSTYKDKQWQSYHIKISSLILALWFRDILKTGVNCYEMKIPVQIFFSEAELRREVLRGLLRGDGGVYLAPQNRSYRKKDRSYTHKNNSIEISYFTSSPTLFEQIQLLFHENDVFPALEKRYGLLTIHGINNAEKLVNFFDGRKKKLIEDYFKEALKQPNYQLKGGNKNYLWVKIKEVKKVLEPQYVYSLEVAKNNTLLTTSGILVHNCIPVDPFYLSWKAKEHGFFARFIELAGEINEIMPHHVVTKVIWALNRVKKPLRGSKILVLGVAYKKDIGDVRETPALPIIKDLIRKGADVNYHDPYVSRFKIGSREMRSVSPIKSAVKSADCVLILTDHSDIDYSMVAKSAKLVVDTRHAVKNKSPNVVSF